ncbi:SSI family serine proteinase inhibitor [Streptomyces bauhiniae]
MTALPRRGIAPLAVSAVSLLCGLTAGPAAAAPALAPGSIPTHAYSAAPARAVHTVPVRTAPALASAPSRATSGNPTSANPTRATSLAPAHAIPTVPVRTALTPTSSAAPGHATPTRAIPATLANAPRVTTPALPPPPLPEDGTGDHLTLVVHGAGPGRDGVRQLFCHPEAGDHPDPAAACRVLDENTRWGRDPFTPVPPDSICTMIDGGTATAHVTGYWAGRPVDAEFSRRNGCEIDRWDRLVPFLPGAGA